MTQACVVAVKTYVKANFGMDKTRIAGQLMRLIHEMFTAWPEAPSMAASQKRARNEYVGWHVPAATETQTRDKRGVVSTSLAFRDVPCNVYSISAVAYYAASAAGNRLQAVIEVEGVRLSRKRW